MVLGFGSRAPVLWGDFERTTETQLQVADGLPGHLVLWGDFERTTETVRFERLHGHCVANLTLSDQEYLEHVLGMHRGYVLKFTDATFERLFHKHGIDIHSPRYYDYGTSKANEMRVFWDKEPDLLVGKVLSDMLDVYEAMSKAGSVKPEPALYEKCRQIVARLCGKVPDVDSTTDEEFPDKEFDMPDIQKLPVDSAVAKIIQGRMDEARACLRAGAYLSPIILWGSVLEAVLLGAAQKAQRKFYSSPSSPKKKDGGAKPLQEWSLMELINVASNVGLLKTDAQGFSQVLRDFRNYIHPAQQAKSDFAPDKYTAKLCLDAFKTALADVAGER